MRQAPVNLGDEVVLDLQGLRQLLEVLAGRGYQLVGPTVRRGALVYDRLSSLADLPQGWGDVQEGGSFRLRRLGEARRVG
jgi:hypothetical protein